MSSSENTQLSLKLGFKPLTEPKAPDTRAASASFLGKVRKEVLASVDGVKADLTETRSEMRQIGDALWAKLAELEGRLP